MRKPSTGATLALLAALGTLFVANDADAARRKRKKRPKVGVVTQLITPIGLQGEEGAGNLVLLPFWLNDLYQRPHELDVEYGRDLDGNGVIDPESEYRSAAPDFAHPNATAEVVENRRGKRRAFYGSLRDPGKPHVFVWNSRDDIEAEGIIRTGDSPGVRIRMRPRRKTGRKRIGAWIYTDPFDLENRGRPQVTLDDVVIAAPVQIFWTAVNVDSEDQNGNGVVDFVEGEDRNGNGLPDLAPIDAEFQYHVVTAGEDPTALAEFELATLDWLPCTQDPFAGDATIDVPTSAVGLGYTFAWDSATDLVQPGTRVILRSRVQVDDTLRSPWVYRATPFVPVE